MSLVKPYTIQVESGEGDVGNRRYIHVTAKNEANAKKLALKKSPLRSGEYFVKVEYNGPLIRAVGRQLRLMPDETIIAICPSAKVAKNICHVAVMGMANGAVWGKR